jgi:RNA polymerase sigma-B factor
MSKHHEHNWRRRLTDRRLAKRGDARARAELVERYLPLARAMAWRYRNRGESLEDLVQVASVGLVKAIERWEPDRGLEFSSFAVPTILGQLRRHFRDNAWAVRPPRRTQELFLLVTRERTRLWSERGRPPRVQELAERLDRSYEEVLDAVEAISAHSPGSLDQQLLPDASGKATPDGLADPEHSYAHVENRLLVDGLMAGVS